MSITILSQKRHTARKKDGGADPEHARQGARREEAAASARDARLGNKSIKSQQQVEAPDLQRRLWALHKTMWAITDYDRLRGCHRYIAGGAGAASLRWHEPGRASWSSLCTSSSVWASPLSAAAIGRTRAEEVTTALKTWFEQGKQHTVEFLTLTLAHSREQELTEVWDTLSYAWRGVVAGASWRGGARYEGDKKRFGVQHWIKSVEVTHGAHGWHVHMHVLLLLDQELTQDQRAVLESNIYGRWSAAAQRKGFKAPSRAHGVKLEKAKRDKNAADLGTYLAKGSIASVAETLSREMTAGQSSKTARGAESRTPFQILDDIRKSGDTSLKNPDVQLWRTWEKQSMGRRQIAWSKGTKDALGVTAVSDEEAENHGEEAPTTVEVARVQYEEWSRTREDTGETLRDDMDTRGDVVAYVAQAKTPGEAHKRAADILRALQVRYQQEDTPIPVEHTGAVVLPVNKEQARELLSPPGRLDNG